MTRNGLSSWVIPGCSIEGLKAVLLTHGARCKKVKRMLLDSRMTQPNMCMWSPLVWKSGARVGDGKEHAPGGCGNAFGWEPQLCSSLLPIVLELIQIPECWVAGHTKARAGACLECQGLSVFRLS